jgi:hypothetical protein
MQGAADAPTAEVSHPKTSKPTATSADSSRSLTGRSTASGVASGASFASITPAAEPSVNGGLGVKSDIGDVSEISVSFVPFLSGDTDEADLLDDGESWEFLPSLSVVRLFSVR